MERAKLQEKANNHLRKVKKRQTKRKRALKEELKKRKKTMMIHDRCLYHINFIDKEKQA